MTNSLRYDRLFENALREVIRRILKQVAAKGLPAGHYFQIGFATGHRGVKMAESLKTRFGRRMTIILQNRFRDLTAGEKSFSVVLFFNNKPQLLEIPYGAISEFTDPEAKFSLQFQGFSVADEPKKNSKLPKIAAKKVVRLEEYRKAKG